MTEKTGALLAKSASQEKVSYPWGWIRWLKSGALDSGATMTLGVCQIDPGKSNPRHFHPNCDEVLYVQSGRCIKSIGSRTFEMGPGDCIRIPRGEEHHARCASPEPFICVIAYDTPEREVVFL
ncbi:MAG: cupin domain-containing protein [Chloroflexi bacterium]|nr:cupin domain-containing protein [Chloroflexota bacterium]